MWRIYLLIIVLLYTWWPGKPTIEDVRQKMRHQQKERLAQRLRDLRKLD